MNKTMLWVLRIIPALIMLQTLFFKFTAATESVQLFTILDMEPWGRIGTGVAELIAAVLLLIPRTTLLGAMMGIGLMSGAIFFHLTNAKIGIYFGGDALLFSYALIVWICCFVLVIILRKKIPALFQLKF